MRLIISHETTYAFAAPAAYGFYQARLTPRSGAGQSVISWRLEVEGGTSEARFCDQFANETHLISHRPGAPELGVRVSGEVETEDRAGVVGVHTSRAPLWLFLRQTPLTAPGKAMRAFIEAVGAGPSVGPLEKLHALSAAILAQVAYTVGRTHVTTRAEEAFCAGHGVCQDHAHIFVGAARALGFPARYVSGYLCIAEGAQAEAGHAWAEAHVEGLGWVGFDVSNGICPDARYVRVACGLDYAQAAPIFGLTFGSVADELSVAVHVQQQ